MFRMLIYWECLLLRCKCICIVKLCLCRERNSFYNLVPIENAFWCNLSAFTFSASLPLNEGLWITFSASLYLFLSKCMHTFQFLVCLHVQEKKKKSQWNSSFIHSSSTTVNTKKTEHPLRLVCLHVQGKKNFPSGTRVPLVWMLKKQSKQSAWNRAFTGWEKKNFPVELMFHRLEFHLEFQTLEFLSYIFFLNLTLFLFFYFFTY